MADEVLTGNGRRQGKSVAMLMMLWAKAYTKDVRIPCPDMASATSLRFRLYGAVKPVRKDPRLAPDLAEKLGGLELVIERHENGAATIVIRKSRAARALAKVFDDLGITEDSVAEPMDSVGAEAKESQERIQQLLNAASGAATTPANSVGALSSGFGSKYPKRGE